MRALCLATLLGLATGAGADAATLRTMTTLSAPVVLVSDLFDEAGAAATRVLGPAPPPGERIVVEAAQLAAIARQFGVDWRPASSADRAVLERPGRTLPRELLIDSLAPALAHAGAPAPNEVSLPGFESPLIPLASQPHALVEQVDYRRESGQFAADVLVTGDGMAPLRLRLSGQVDEIAMVPVAVRRLPLGAVIGARDLAPARIRVASLRTDVVRDPAQAQGMALRRAVGAGQPVALDDLQRPEAIAKGAHVTLELSSAGLSVAAMGLAMAPGALGERIAVLNPVSHMVVEGEIVGPNRVSVAPDSVPMPADQRSIRALGVTP